MSDKAAMCLVIGMILGGGLIGFILMVGQAHGF